MSGLGAIFLLAAAIDAATPQDIETAKALASEAADARAQGNPWRALELLQKAHALTASPALLHNIALIYEDLGRYSDATRAYQRVIDDPIVRPEVQIADAKRLAALAPKLASGWVAADADAVRAGALFDGSPLSEAERAAPAGAHVAEAWAANALVLRKIDLVLGARRTLAFAELSAQPGDGTLRLEGLPTNIASISVDDYAIRAKPGSYDALVLASGAHQIRFVRTDGSEERAKIAIFPGASVAHGDVVELERAISSAPPAPSKARWAPWAVAGAGAIAAGAGIVLFAGASAERAELTADLGPLDGHLITEVSFAQAARIEASTNTRGAIGAVLIGAAAAAIGTGVALWVLGE